MYSNIYIYIYIYIYILLIINSLSILCRCLCRCLCLSHTTPLNTAIFFFRLQAATEAAITILRIDDMIKMDQEQQQGGDSAYAQAHARGDLDG